MKKIAVSLVLVLLLVAALPVSASARASLDTSFGTGGRVLAPAPGPFPPDGPEANARLATASTPDGKLVALVGDRRVLRFLENGKADPSFGDGGSIDVAVEPGRGFSPTGVAVDSQGRILVGGTSVPPPGTANPGPKDSPSGPTPTRATVIRYLPDGTLDPSFGNGGVATTSFELPPPSLEPANSVRRYESPVVAVAALAVTAADQPVVAGTYATVASADCYAYDGYIGRLDADGHVDRGFAKEGVAVDAQIRKPQQLAQSPLGDLFYSGLNTPEPVGCIAPGPQSINGSFADLLPTGLPNTAFGGSGQVSHPISEVYGLAVDSRGRLVSLEQSYPASYPEAEGRLRVRRLLPSGAPDPAFGKNGSTWPKASLGVLRRVGFLTMALDSRNRILLAGGGKTQTGAFGFQLMRLGTKGKLDRGFGRKGRIKTGFGPTAETKASTVILGDDGKAILGGSITGSPKLPGGDGFAFARYSL